MLAILALRVGGADGSVSETSEANSHLHSTVLSSMSSVPRWFASLLCGTFCCKRDDEAELSVTRNPQVSHCLLASDNKLHQQP